MERQQRSIKWLNTFMKMFSLIYHDNDADGIIRNNVLLIYGIIFRIATILASGMMYIEREKKTLAMYLLMLISVSNYVFEMIIATLLFKNSGKIAEVIKYLKFSVNRKACVPALSKIRNRQDVTRKLLRPLNDIETYFVIIFLITVIFEIILYLDNFPKTSNGLMKITLQVLTTMFSVTRKMAPMSFCYFVVYITRLFSDQWKKLSKKLKYKSQKSVSNATKPLILTDYDALRYFEKSLIQVRSYS